MRSEDASPHSGRVAVLAGCGLGLVAGAAVLFAQTGLPLWTSFTRSGLTDPAEALLLVVCVAGALLAAWVGLGLTCCAAGTAPGVVGAAGRRLARWSPPVSRRIAVVVLGSTLGTAVAPSALATTGTDPARGGVSAIAALPVPSFEAAAPRNAPGTATLPDPGFAQRPSAPKSEGWGADGLSLPAPGWSPSRPVAPAATSASLDVLDPTRHRAHLPELERVVVRRGDTLWAIAARHLGPGATAAEVAHEWPRWQAANLDVIGADPDLLVPGQQLQPPSPNRGTS